MKRIVLLLILSFLFSSSVFAKDGPNSNGTNTNNQQSNKNWQRAYQQNSDKEDSDDFYNELINQDYGSDQSPEFNNTEEMNPGQADYGYQGN